ncbi:hypothetical protein D9757_014115 [Collybiopsis confluens]|uniref:Uncharacterized protein n=1 Tax=Collybiopsis confluens TaxID=2823264 RepID=A0A8H5CL71_9AGAR|nr:hypothetical protein D9757_014115 [Collybiopsis confluens]
MPHKRAKRSVREQQRSQKGTDLAPSKESLSHEALPKSVVRVLNAAQIREEWKTKKRTLEDKEESRAKKRKISSSIQPRESLQHYNKRVENDMRPLVRNAVHSSNAVVRNVRKQQLSTKATSSRHHSDNPPSPPPVKRSGQPKDFQSISSSAPKRLNDIAQAPPEFTRLPGRLKGSAPPTTTRTGVLSLAQTALMAQEREKAIARYRQLKASRRKANNDEVGERGKGV